MNITIKAELICEFDTFQQWVNKASSRLGGFSGEEKIICVDKNGEACSSGRQFMYARDNGLFPVKAYRLIKNTDFKETAAMNYKQQIEQKAEDYTNSREGAEYSFWEGLYQGYRAGAEAAIEIANTWIPVEERLPDFGKTVLAKDNGGYFFTACVSVHGWVNNERGEYFDIRRRVTHWKPITL